MKPEVLIQANYLLAESPLWDPRNETLYYTDILAKKIYSYHWKSQRLNHYELPFMVGSLGLCEDQRLILATSQGFSFFDTQSQELQWICNPEKEIPNNRFNDGKCDPWGNFWAGTMDLDIKENQGSLYRLSPELKCEKILTGLTISNGLCWDTEKELFYFIDTPTQRIMSYRSYKDKTLSNPKAVIQNQSPGGFDGMTMDEQGQLYVAKFQGHSIEVYHPETNKLSATIELPVSCVTSCAFGGPNNNILFVTSASFLFNPGQLSSEPLAGSIFSITLETKGQSSHYFQNKIL